MPQKEINDPSIKSKHLKITTRHCLLNRLFSANNSLNIIDMGAGEYTNEDISVDNPGEEAKPYIDLSITFKADDDIENVIEFELIEYNDNNDQEHSSGQHLLRNNGTAGILTIENIDGDQQMTVCPVKPMSILVNSPTDNITSCYHLHDFSEELSHAALEIKGQTWKWAKIATCNN